VTTPFDPRDKMWEIRVQPYDVITYDLGSGKRGIGQVGDVHSSICTAGRLTTYEVRGVDWSDVAEIDNGHDPQKASPEIATEFKAQREAHNRRRVAAENARTP